MQISQKAITVQRQDKNYAITQLHSIISPSIITTWWFSLTSVPDLNNILVDLRFSNSDLRGQFDILCVIILILLHEGWLHWLTGLGAGAGARAAVGPVGVQAVVAGVSVTGAGANTSPLSSEEYPLFQINSEIRVSCVRQLYVTHHCKYNFVTSVEKSIFKRWLKTNV